MEAALMDEATETARLPQRNPPENRALPPSLPPVSRRVH
jgi:hypothetical protein